MTEARVRKMPLNFIFKADFLSDRKFASCKKKKNEKKL